MEAHKSSICKLNNNLDTTVPCLTKRIGHISNPQVLTARQKHNVNFVSEVSRKEDGEHTLLADRGGFWMEDWHKIPPRPELSKLVGVEMVEVALN